MTDWSVKVFKSEISNLFKMPKYLLGTYDSDPFNGLFEKVTDDVFMYIYPYKNGLRMYFTSMESGKHVDMPGPSHSWMIKEHPDGYLESVAFTKEDSPFFLTPDYRWTIHLPTKNIIMERHVTMSVSISMEQKPILNRILLQKRHSDLFQ